jgi:hypothetical protein
VELAPEVPHVDLAPEVPHVEPTPEPEVQHVELTPEISHVQLTPEVSHVEITPEAAHVEMTPEVTHKELTPELRPEVEPVDIVTEATDAEEVEVDLGRSCPAQVQGITLQNYCTENGKKIFPKRKLRGLSPNLYIHISVSDLYIFPRSVCLYGCSKKGSGPILGIYKSLLTDV